MKPIVIYPNNNSKNVVLTKEEFEKYLKEAYDTGYSDGRASVSHWNWWNTPITTTPYYTTATNTGDAKKPLDITWSNETANFTCEAHNDI